MWHLLCKKVYGIEYTIRLSIGLACGIHLFFFLFFAIAHWCSPAIVVQISRNRMNTNNTLIIIDPHATMQSVNVPQSSPQAIVKKNNATVFAKTQHKKVSTKQITKQKQTVPRKDIKKQKPIIKETKKTTTVVKKSAVKNKPVLETVKKLEPKKSIVQKKNEPVTAKPPTPTLNPQQESVVAPPSVAADLPTSTEQSVHSNSEGPILIARSTQEAAALTIQLQLQEELLRVWHPPVGVEEGVSCHMRVALDATGNVQQIDMIQSSGMILFDVSARAAIQQTVWPKGMWGTILELILQ